MSYDPPIKLYYVPNNENISEEYRIVPAPQIDIKPELYYANDIVVGYTYIINFIGYATALDLRNPSSYEPLLEQTLQAIKTIKNLFLINNGTLIVLYNNQEILRANGGLTKNLSFSDSDNNWVNYAPYSASVEFNELSTGSCDISLPVIDCNSTPSGIVSSSQLIEMQKYRVQSFKDSWSFNLDENIFVKNNQYFTVEYTVSATGKHYFDNNELLPAWEQAKNFCQDRLYKQISRLTSTALETTYTNCLTNGQTLASLFSEGANGALKDIDVDSEYGIFNETITSSSSEANGSFTLKYKAIIKIIKADDKSQNSIHTYTVSKNVSNTTNKVISYDVEGEIRGLIPGGLLKQLNSNLSLQQQDELLIESSPSSNKYANAKATFLTIGNDNGLKKDFIKNQLSISYGLFIVDSSPHVCDDEPPSETSFVVTHDYDNGIIKYKAGFDNQKVCNQLNDYNITSVNLTIEDSVPMIAEFIIPGRKQGPIIQLLNAQTSKTYNFSVQGIPPSVFCNTKSLNELFMKYCEESFNSKIPLINFNNMILADEKYSKSSDGSYTLNRKYIQIDTQ